MDASNSTDASDNHLVIALAVGIPCVAIIVVLFALILFMCYLIIRNSFHDYDAEVDYRQKRFQGISLEQQRAMARAKRKSFLPKMITSRARSEDTHLGLRPQAVPSSNPFKLQEWQLRMSGIDVPRTTDPERDTAELEESVGHTQTVIYGAVNPLLIGEERRDDSLLTAYKQEASSNDESEDTTSSDSFNPYD